MTVSFDVDMDGSFEFCRSWYSWKHGTIHKLVWHSGQWYFVLRRNMRPCASIVFQQKLQPSAGPGRITGQCWERFSIEISRIKCCQNALKSKFELVTNKFLDIANKRLHTCGDETERCNSSERTRNVGWWSIGVVGGASETTTYVELKSCGFGSCEERATKWLLLIETRKQKNGYKCSLVRTIDSYLNLMAILFHPTFQTIAYVHAMA